MIICMTLKKNRLANKRSDFYKISYSLKNLAKSILGNFEYYLFLAEAHVFRGDGNRNILVFFFLFQNAAHWYLGSVGM